MLHVACCRLMAHKLLWNSQQSNRSAKPTVRQHRRLRTAQNSSQHATSSDPWTYLPLELVALLADEPLVRQPREHGRRPSGAVLACGRLTAAAPMCLPTMATVGHRCDAAGPHECSSHSGATVGRPTYLRTCSNTWKGTAGRNSARAAGSPRCNRHRARMPSRSRHHSAPHRCNHGIDKPFRPIARHAKARR